MELDARTRLAREVAESAGALLLEIYRRDRFEVKGKGQNDLVTEADYAAESLVLARIREAFPEDTIIAEESGVMEKETGYTWVVDPLDGTVNFAHRLPEYAVSVGCLKDGRSWAGAVCLPVLGLLFHAEKGRGAFCNGEPIRISHPVGLSDTLLAMDFALRSYTSLSEHLRLYGRLLPLCMNIVKPESAVMSTAYVACGRFGAVLEQSLCIWDIAATAPILEEAGAAVTDAQGLPLAFDRILPYSVLAASPQIHGEILSVLRTG